MSDRHRRKRATIAANLEAQTGRTLAEWAAIAGQAPVEGFMGTVDWLKAHHGLSHFQARLVAEQRRDAAGRTPPPARRLRPRRPIRRR
jgi:hypothetical protein